MSLTTLFSAGDRELTLAALPPPVTPVPASPLAPSVLERLLPGHGSWDVELGFGKGRYLLAQAVAHPERRYLGLEVASEYYRLLRRRACRRRLANLVLIRGEALYLLATVLPRGFAARLHVYFPDPWPKLRHHKRRLFDPATVDLVVGVLAPGGELAFATDFLDYGERVAEILAGHPDLEIQRRDAPWPDGARTHYEAKYIAEGRPILRLEGHRRDAAGPVALHPAGRASLLAAVAPR